MLPPSDWLPAAERRRVGVPVKLALAVGREALSAADRDPASIAAVFTSSSADCDNLHHICESLATPAREVSPTRFHNSVHNAPAGYWSIATRSQQPSTSLCCRDESFAAGLLEASVQVVVDRNPVVLIAYDHPYREPLHSVRPISSGFAVALVLTGAATGRGIAALDIAVEATVANASTMSDASLEALRAGVPAARSLPIFAALARRTAGALALEYVGGNHLHVGVEPC